MKIRKTILFISSLLALSITGCGTDTANESSEDSVNSITNTSSNQNEESPVLHGHGVPSNSQGELYALYVDDDTGKIYEKSKAYSAPSASAVKLAASGDEAKWIYTNCLAGENFNKTSSVANAIRATLLSTNITLKCTLNIETNTSTQPDVVTYLAYNFGNVLQKQVTDPNQTYDQAMTIGYSTYNVDSDAYHLYIMGVDHTEYITSENVGERMIASNFINRCLNNQLEKICNFALCDTILSELDNFVATDKVYSLNKTITITSSPYYDELYGAGTYYVEFKNFEFKLSNDGESLERFKFTFGYGKNDRSEYMEEEFLAEISNLRTTSFSIE